MTLNVRQCVYLFVTVLLMYGCTNQLSDSSSDKQAATSLLKEFETVFRAETDLVASSGGYKRLTKEDSDALRVPFALLLTGMDSLRAGLEQLIRPSDSILVGAKDFRPPQGLGGVQSNLCYVIVFSSKVAGDPRVIFPNPPVDSSSGNSTWQWSAPPSEGHPEPYTLHLTQLSPRFLVICSSLPELEILTKELRSDGDPNAAASAFPELSRLMEREYWAYRRYRHNASVNEFASGLVDLTSSAESLLFSVDPSLRVGALRLLTADSSAPKKLNEALARTASAMDQLALADGRAWETTIRFDGSRSSIERMIYIMGLFGFGVYL